MKKWKVLQSHYAFDNPWMKVRQDKVELANGKILDDFFVYEEGSVVMVVPILPDGTFVFVKQYKHAAGEIVIEFPAGYIDKDETPIEAAKRELKEETGFISDIIEPLTEFYNNPSKVVNTIHTFLAPNVKQNFDQKAHQDDSEDIEIVTVSFDKAHEMIKNGEIKVTGTIAAFYTVADKLGLIK